MITLFPDQEEALARVLEVYHKQPIGGRALVVAPTAWGKTIFFSFLARALQGLNILIVAHRDELLEQARDKYHLIDPTAIVGKVGSGVYEWGAQITVAGVDTISKPRHLENLQKYHYDVIIFDECHHCPAPKYQKIMNALKDAFMVAVTATAKRLDNQSLSPLFGRPVFVMEIIEAIELGRLCNLNPAIAIESNIELANIHSKKNADGDTDFNDRELALAIDIQERNELIVRKYQEYTPGKRAVAFCVNVEHATHLADTFNRAGIPAAVITGETSIEDRKPIYKAYKSGEIRILTNVQVLTEGWDEPLAEVAIMARPTQSWALYVQCIGRVLRLSPGKVAATILDITDNCIRLRLSPQNLRKAIGLTIQKHETALDAIIREKKVRKQEEKEALIAKLTAKRVKDLQVNMFETLEWQELSNGNYMIEVTSDKHKIALLPLKSNPDLFEVWARLAPVFKPQKWMGAQELEHAQEWAEKRVSALHNDPTLLWRMDKESSWRELPIDPNGKQVKKMERHHLEWNANMTKGDASDLIDAHLARVAREKMEKAARKAAKSKGIESYA